MPSDVADADVHIAALPPFNKHSSFGSFTPSKSSDSSDTDTSGISDTADVVVSANAHESS